MFKHTLLLCGLLLSSTTNADMIIGQYKNGDCGGTPTKSNDYTKDSGCVNFITGAGSIRVHNTGINNQHIEFYNNANCGDGNGQVLIKAGQNSCYVQKNGDTAAGYKVSFIY